MANNLQRVHGDVQPVFAIDTRNGPVTVTTPTGVATNFIGPAMDFFGIDAGGAVSFAAEMQVGGAVEAILNDIAQLATVMLYQVETGVDGGMSIAVYPKGAYTAATLQTQLRLLTSVGAGPVNLNAATVTDVGFKLAVA